MRFISILAISAIVAGSAALIGATASGTKWSAEQRTVLASLALASLEQLPADASNRVADDTRAARLGRQLFFDTSLSSNGKVACATCHLPDRDFQDDTPLARGVGVTGRRTMPIAGTAHSPWMFWDGRMDSQWSQALGPLESPVEHGGDRTQYVHYIATRYKQEYEQIFGRLPNLHGLPRHASPNGDSILRAAWSALPAERRDAITRVYANMGKSIAAFERTIAFGETRFDRYVAVELAGKPHTRADALSPEEEAGLRLFIGKANCVNCHNGARLTDDHFHNTGVPASSLVATVDSGRSVGVRQVIAGEFNCLSKFSDAKPGQCAELRFAVTEGDELVRAFKTPSLRNVAERAPFMHAGQLATLADVIAHYDRAPRAPFGKSELRRLRLSERERRQLEAFLRTLSAPAVVPNEMNASPIRSDPAPSDADVVASFGPILSHNGTVRGAVVAAAPVSSRDSASATWTVRLERPSGGEIADAMVRAIAHMPETGVEMPGKPSVRYVGAGRYEIGNLRFRQPGWWNVGLVVESRGSADSLAFNVVVP